jgi:hypothetical protein
MKKIWIAALMGVLFTGCAGVDSLQESLRNRSGNLLYLHDSLKTAEKQGGTLKIGTLSIDDFLPPSTTVKEESGFFLPLLVVNVWKYGYQSSLGSAQIANDYKLFIRESLVEELKRSAKFSYVEEHGDMELDLKIKEITMAAPIYKNGNFLFLFFSIAYSQNISAGPVDVVVKADALIRKNGKELFSQEFQGNGRAGILQGANIQLEDYTIAMIEALSLAIKGLNENIIKEVNKLSVRMEK